ncbi:ABC transporter ATP-binding protein [Mycoplasmopsis synoviae]|uniref:ABC transporter ATP-binding protein/permease n=2 Tax=Mycoplasmopsis synoviae TaxID=2109 RepID=A0AAX3EZW8_MYCSY|nr:ABC transporter ATP-binding protein [Mycoplasmopsis synoviae]MBD5788868.1 ABC transporter, ATP-binding protein [Mycoplasmopsis synoviae GX11-T]QGL45472.1 ABC transporter ATP-binding protein [Mycoplasmopsis synoviae]QXV99317.1 ABC transporter ATP-binding protein/permease [Mycoplasmopsis synoviae]UBM43498.1 ABC transporter ATP-binding protein/permease [Mycoplasmopsis synoviae]ULL02269.1 ABC transporter ATP-binding protein [Mycoplasmopsis synoviae]
MNSKNIKNKKPLNNFQSLIRISKYIMKENKFKLFLVFLLVLITASGVVYWQFFIGNLIIKNLFEQPDNLFLINGKYNPDFKFDDNYFILIMTLSFFIFLLVPSCQYLYQRIMISIAFKTIGKLRRELYAHMQRLPLEFFNSESKGEILANFTANVDVMRQFLTGAFPNVINTIFITFSLFFTLLFINWFFALITIFFLLIILLISGFFTFHSSKNFIKKQNYINKSTGFAEEYFSGIREVKIFSQEKNVIQNYQKINTELRSADRKATTYSDLLFPIAINIANFAFILIAILGAFMILDKNFPISIKGLTLGVVISSAQTARGISRPVTDVFQQINLWINAVSGARKIFTLFDVAEESNSGKVTLVKIIFDENTWKETNAKNKFGISAWKITKENDEVEYKPVNGEIVFENVYFNYKNTKDNSNQINGVSFRVSPGEQVALVGHTGAGKSTIINLLNRFYEINSGNIFIDGINIKDIEKNSLRKSIGMIMQESSIFTDTIINNMTYGSEHYDENLVFSIAESYGINNFSNLSENKYQNFLKDLGSSLSEGQKQLLSIIRASYLNTNILVLDEATSNIDTKTEEIIQKSFNKLMRSKTIITIAHRLSTIKNVDKILFLENGKIIESGSHKELIKQKGKYYQLWAKVINE